MSKTTHTPGPWRVSRISGIPIGVERVIAEIGGGSYSEMICNSILPEDNEWKQQKRRINADMRLIAAAPEMLEVLEWFVAAHKNGQCGFKFNDENNRGLDEINRVIKKAKGK